MERRIALGTEGASSVGVRMRITLACAVIAGITTPACSLGMADLSDGNDASGADRTATNGSPPAAAEPADQADEALPDTKLDEAPPIAAPPMATGCQLVTLIPSTAVSAGGGQGWSATTCQYHKN